MSHAETNSLFNDNINQVKYDEQLNNRHLTHAQPSKKCKHAVLLLVLMFIMSMERVIGGYYFNMNHLEYSINLTERESMAAGFVVKFSQPNYRLLLALSCSFLLPLMGGLLGDGILGRFKCAIIGESLHVVVSIFFTASLLVTNETAIHAFVYTADCLLIFCFGLLVVNVQAMGACLAETSFLLRKSTYFAIISTIQIFLIAPGVQLTLINDKKYKIIAHCVYFFISCFCVFLLYMIRNYYINVHSDPRRVYKVIGFIFCRCCSQKVPLIQRNVAVNNSYRMDAQKFTKVLPLLTALMVQIVNTYFCQKFLITNSTLDVLIIFSPFISGLVYIFLTVKFDSQLLITHRIHMGVVLSTVGYISAAICVYLETTLVILNTFIIFVLSFGQLVVYSAGKEMLCVYLPTNMEAIAIGLYETSFGLSTVILYAIGMYSKSMTSIDAFAGIVSMTAFITFFQIVTIVYQRIKR